MMIDLGDYDEFICPGFIDKFIHICFHNFWRTYR